MLLAAVPVLVGCNPEGATVDQQFLKLSDAVCTFKQEGGEEIVINVKANPQWKVDENAPWLHITDQTDNSFTITADKNEDIERATMLTVTSGTLTESISVKQLGYDGDLARYRLMAEWKNVVVSPNGRYAGGTYADVAKDDSFEYYVEVVDLHTEEKVVHGPYPQALYYIGNADAISDEGTIYVDNSNGGSVEIKLNGENRKTIVPEGSSGQVKVKGVSSDGSVAVGYSTGSAIGNAYAAIKIEDGIVSVLPIPETNYRDQEWYTGVLARGVSADGSIMYGTTWEKIQIDDQGMVYWDKEGNVEWVGDDVHELSQTITLEDGLGNPYSYNLYNGFTCNGSSNTQISPNGKWIAGTYRTEDLSDDKKSIVYELYPAFYNTETKKTTIFHELKDCVGMAASDEGLGFVGGDTGASNGVILGVGKGIVVDIENATQIGSMESWVKDTYGITIPSYGYIRYMCGGGQVILGGTRIADAALEGGRSAEWYIAPPIKK